MRQGRLNTTAPQSAHDLVAILEGQKEIVGSPEWQKIPRNRRPSVGVRQKLDLSASLSYDEVVIEGVQLRISCPLNHPNQRVSVMLMAIDARRKPACFARIDWNGDPHENTHPVAGVLRLTDAGHSHFHDPRLLTDWSFSEILSTTPDIPVAVPLPVKPASFNELLEISGTLLYIKGMSGIDMPPWIEANLI